MAMLWANYKTYIDNGRIIVIPQVIKEFTKRCITDNDPVADFIKQKLVKEGNYQIAISEVFLKFKEWVNTYRFGIKMMDQKVFGTQFKRLMCDNVLGDFMINHQWKGGM